MNRVNSRNDLVVMMTELIPGIIIIIADCGRIVEISYPFVYSTFSD